MASIRFLGAAGTVTGSRHLVRAGGRQVLVDAGLFQGLKELRLRNWAELPIPPASIDAVILTHAHVDHSGALPLLARQGLRCQVWCTPATRDLCALLLPDSARLQEEEARWANRRGYSKHAPNARPLYDEADAARALDLLAPVRYGVRQEVAPGIAFRFHRAGHILGSATVELELSEPGAPLRRVLFSGDLGRYGVPILPDPEPARAADALVVECTYGDRAHPPGSPADALAGEVQEAVRRGGALVIPAFAVGRTQEILFHLRALEAAGRIPELPVFVDSPMAIDATALHAAHRDDLDDEMARLLAEGQEPLRPRRLAFARTPEQSKAINHVEGPCVILSASGMATGGRVLHHLAHRLPDPRTTVLLVGFQAAGTRGASLLSGAATLRIHGEEVPVRARVAALSGFSAHGDRDEVGRWLAALPRPPALTCCVHGEPAALAATQARLRAAGWEAAVPRHLEELPLP
ncbi:MBL fold metallo-hydrolase RNA specificity domain-containing protein [Anaeromyxobacter paludicola]|uniref:MBL fold hydrolase n=1 Tax=Anaeromyxobacter paludicola TaxID=2918171 RepID=A0ABN6N2Q0_9BACT|nr:MBL fold metallo-hydrolase [Anaeromyxobacter paludicola]BDG07341.1 MBL fold hydrolase [Anaeromyxobacter paludicola]